MVTVRVPKPTATSSRWVGAPDYLIVSHLENSLRPQMGAVLASKNSFCEPENGELPVLNVPSNILEEDDLLALRERLPTRLENHPWSLVFSTTRDGFSLSQLYRKLHEVDSVVLLVIQVALISSA